MIYIGAMAVVGLVGTAAVIMHQPPMRECPNCGTNSPLSSSRCKTCNYRSVTASSDTR